jgi:hypothetical protein
MAYRRVPKRIVITGDVDRGKTYIGQADSQLNILQNQMQFQNLKQGWRTVRLADDVVVECWSCFSLSAVRIHVTPSRYVDEKREREEKWCLCFPCFASGVIEKVFPEEATEDDLINGVRFTYDISVCTGSAYVLFKDFKIRSAGWGKYYNGQLVWVSLDIMSIDSIPRCCEDTKCLINREKDLVVGSLTSLSVMPVYFPEIKKWYVKDSNI